MYIVKFAYLPLTMDTIHLILNIFVDHTSATGMKIIRKFENKLSLFQLKYLKIYENYKALQKKTGKSESQDICNLITLFSDP